MEKKFYTSRSREVAYLNCPRLGYTAYDWDGTGLESESTSLPLINGNAIHEGIAGILTGGSYEVAIARQLELYRTTLNTRGVRNEAGVALSWLEKEQETLLRGTVAAWMQERLPQLQAEFEVVAVEKELLWEMGEGVVDRVRCDVLARRRSDGGLFYVEWKTTSQGGEEWAKQWEHNTQLLLNTRAVEEVLKERVEGVMIEGLVKGRRKIDEARGSAFYGQRIQVSPLCYGYRHAQTGEYRARYTSQGGWYKVAVWEEMPVEEWVETVMTKEERMALFAPVPPIRPSAFHLDRAQRQVVASVKEREAKLQWVRSGPAATLQERLDLAFPMNDEHCFRYWGSPCEFERLCFSQQISEDPLGSGLYRRKQSHHEPVEGE